jgi:hypothetical protein
MKFTLFALSALIGTAAAGAGRPKLSVSLFDHQCGNEIGIVSPSLGCTFKTTATEWFDSFHTFHACAKSLWSWDFYQLTPYKFIE